MSLADSYTLKPNSIPTYFDSIQRAEAPERFSVKFMENLDFKSTNDRPFIGILKDLGFLDADGVPTPRYYAFLDKSQSRRVVAEGLREAFADLFAVNTEANKLSLEEIKGKLRTLYAGAKKDGVIDRIARTFVALCQYADFSKPREYEQKKTNEASHPPAQSLVVDKPALGVQPPSTERGPLSLKSLQYHINIVLPESRDQAVYDAIFKALREHLG